MNRYFLIFILLSFNLQALSYLDIKSPLFDNVSESFKLCFTSKFNQINNLSSQDRKGFFKALDTLCPNQSLQDKKYIVKSCIINGYLNELKVNNFNKNIEDTIEIAQSQMIKDCENYLKEINPKLSSKEKKELISLIYRATLKAKDSNFITDSK